MTPAWLIGFVGLGMVYALLATAAILAVAGLAGRQRQAVALLPLLLTTLFFVFLTMHPFPPPASISCPVPQATPALQPFGYWPTVTRFWQEGAGPARWLGNKLLLSTLMNYLLCVLIGAALARHVARFRTAVAAALALTLTVELTQLTGIWGIYPCAIRQFNVDDLMLNSLGVLTGFALMRLAGLRPRRAVGA